MDLRNPHTGELVHAPEHESRGSPTIGRVSLEMPDDDGARADTTLPQDELGESRAQRMIRAKAEHAANVVAQALADANAWAALGIGPDVLARCEAEGASPKLVKRLLSERTAAKAALDGIDHVLAMLGIEAI